LKLAKKEETGGRSRRNKLWKQKKNFEKLGREEREKEREKKSVKLEAIGGFSMCVCSWEGCLLV
jgi:hypothetical protein